MIRFLPYVLAVGALVSFGWYVRGLRADNVALRAAQEAAMTRDQAIQKDMKSDATIDKLDDADLRDAPDRWMLPIITDRAPSDGGLY